jgi:hypothetical protein
MSIVYFDFFVSHSPANHALLQTAYHLQKLTQMENGIVKSRALNRGVGQSPTNL